jgi:malonyl-CoA O-methyltransferase
MNTLMIDKQQLRRSFNAAANTYNQAAKLQRNIGLDLLCRHQNIISNANHILDLGSGTGFIGQQIISQYPNKKIIALDIAENMLTTQQHCSRVCADAEQLCFQANSFDLVISNLTLQWCVNLPHTLQEIKNILTPSGSLVFSTFGPNTLSELKSAWQQVDGYTHVNQFHNQTALQKMLEKAGFKISQLTTQTLQQHFPSLKALMLNLKQLGAHNVNQQRSRGLFGKEKFQQLARSYPQSHNMLPVTFEMHTVLVKKPKK